MHTQFHANKGSISIGLVSVPERLDAQRLNLPIEPIEPNSTVTAVKRTRFPYWELNMPREKPDHGFELINFSLTGPLMTQPNPLPAAMVPTITAISPLPVSLRTSDAQPVHVEA